MIQAIKELICVLVIATVIFYLAKPFASLFISAEDLARRRTTWYLLTVAAFLSPDFWLWALIAVPVMFIAGGKDSNPAALYLMLLQVIPQVDVPVPMIGMESLFYVNNYLLLGFCVMTPAALRIWRAPGRAGRSLDLMDFCLLGYGALAAVLYLHTEAPGGGVYPGSTTESLRRAFVFFFGVYVAYFALSRLISNRRLLVDAMATFCLSCALMAGIGVFESARHWLLYNMPERWGYPASFSMYLLRASSLRAMASSGHSLALGHLLVIALGFWLYLQTRLQSRPLRWGVTILLWAGLIAAYARGAWIAGAAVFFLYALLGPNPVSRLFKVSAAAAAVALLVYLSPLGERIANALPFLGGTVDNYNVLYRERLWDRSWQIILQSPLWGDPEALLKMQDLRQGQGIIDLVNSYLQILLNCGFVGLALIMLFMLLALLRTYLPSRRAAQVDPDFSRIGVSLTSCILATLLLIGNGSFTGVAPQMFFVIGAMAAAYWFVARRLQAEPIPPLEIRADATRADSAASLGGPQ